MKLFFQSCWLNIELGFNPRVVFYFCLMTCFMTMYNSILNIFIVVKVYFSFQVKCRSAGIRDMYLGCNYEGRTVSGITNLCFILVCAKYGKKTLF